MALGVLLAGVAPVLPALAHEAASSSFRTGTRSGSYEDAQVQAALAEAGLREARRPEGQPIRFVRSLRRDVFAEGELLFDWLVWFNHFHWLTQESVVLRELRLRQGEGYRAVAARETERNLRALGIFSLVRVVPVEAPDGVGVVVFTRDLWSLRLETDFRASNNTLQFLAQLVERNLFGDNQQAAIRFERRWDSFSIGQFFVDYRAFGGRLRLQESADLIFNGGSGEPEGAFGSFRFGRPFYNLDQQWAFDLTLSLLQYINRDPELGETTLVNLDEPDSPCTLAMPGCARSVYEDLRLSGTLGGSYRRGQAYKQAFSAGIWASHRHVAVVAETRLRPGYEDAFAQKVLPNARTQVGPYVGYSLFVPDYVHFQNLGSFGRVETVRRGPTLAARFTFPLEALGSTANAMLVSGEAGYVFAGGDAVAALSLAAGSRLERGRTLDQSLGIRLRGATPPWLWGRLVWQGWLQARRRDTAQTYVTLGSLTGLRGYPEGSFRGRGVGVARSNLEYRTNPIDIESVHLGLVAFWDAGGLFRHVSELSLAHGVGLGLRVFFPQLNRMPFRFDFGVPLQGSGFSVQLALGADQQVPLTPEEDDNAAADIRGR